MNTCTLCENPYPYWCEECCCFKEEQACIIEETQYRKLYIGSGEDVCLETMEEHS